MSGDPPLDDVTVLELGHIVAGPFCALLLADLGAEVVKVEHPEGGDAIRDSSPVGNSSFNAVNRDKASVTVNLKHEDGQAVFRDLVRNADVVVENFAPGTTERLGVDYESVREVREDVVYCSIKGFNAGPYEDYPALDPIAEAMSGLMSVTGNSGQPPVRSGTSLADMAASFYGALSVTAALDQRNRTGDGQHVTVPLFESTVSLMGYWLAYTQAYDDVPEPLGAGHPNWAPYDVYRTRDDEWVFVGPSSDRQWRRLRDALGLDVAAERFETLEQRRARRDELDDVLTDAVSTLDLDDVLDRLRDASVPVAPVNDTRQVVEDEHLAATDALAEVEAVEGDGGRVKVPRYPVRSSAFARRDSESPPRLGEDTDAVLDALGYDAARIEELRDTDAI